MRRGKAVPRHPWLPAALVVPIPLVVLGGMIALRWRGVPLAAPPKGPAWSELRFARPDGETERHCVGGRGGTWVRNPATGEAVEIPEGAVFATIEP